MFEINNKTLKLCRNYDLSLRYFIILWHDIKSRFFNSPSVNWWYIIRLFNISIWRVLRVFIYFGIYFILDTMYVFQRLEGVLVKASETGRGPSMFQCLDKKKGEENTEFLFFKWYLNFISLWKLKLKCYIEMRNKLNCTLRLKFYL